MKDFSNTLLITELPPGETVTNRGLTGIYFEVTFPLDCQSQEVSSSKNIEWRPIQLMLYKVAIEDYLPHNCFHSSSLA